MARAFFSLFLIFSFAQAEEKSGKNVFTHLIRPVLDAKCVQCHGADKDKGKLRMHTKEDFLKGGKEVGEDIVIKGNVDDSELIYRITLPKDDDEAMPPFKDKEHYNPVTPQELQVMKAWIKLGASFDHRWHTNVWQRYVDESALTNELGGNDALRGYPRKQTASNLEEIQ